MARKSIYIAGTDTKLSAKPNVDTTPFWHCINAVFFHRFLLAISTKTFQ